MSGSDQRWKNVDRCIPSGCNLICINRMRPASITVVHTLLTAPLPNRGSAPPPRSACSYLVRYFQYPKLSKMVENRQQQSWKMPHYCLHQREEIRRLTKKSGVKRNNWTEPNIRPSFQWWRELRDLYRLRSDAELAAFFAGQVRLQGYGGSGYSNTVISTAWNSLLSIPTVTINQDWHYM